MDQNLFRELITQIKKLADENGGALSTQKIDAFFAAMELQEEQLKLIYDYLNAQGINIEGYIGSAGLKAEVEAEKAIVDAKKMLGIDNNPETEMEEGEAEEENGLELFLEKISQRPETDSITEQLLFERAADGDAEAIKTLTDVYLPAACDMAGEYEGKGMSAEDLIQEASIGLLTALSSVEKMESLAAYQASVMNAVSRYLEDTVKANSDLLVRDNALAEKVNHLNDAAKSLTEELGHPVSVEELSAFLEIPVEELNEVIKLAGNNMQF